MNVCLFGASGMVGAGTLLECLDDPRVTSVLVVGRTPCGITHGKITEVRHHDFTDFSPLANRFRAIDACFFCLGVSSAGMTESAYTAITYDVTIAAARALVAANPSMVFCYVSGTGTDSTERGRAMWARVKGRTENALLAMGFRAAYMFRPGYIQPVRGVKSKTGWVNAVYAVIGPLYPLLRAIAPGAMTTSAAHGKAFIAVAAAGYPSPLLYARDINRLAGER
jgi:uncharacterized protein YbjT (DUF2867 family)